MWIRDYREKEYKPFVLLLQTQRQRIGRTRITLKMWCRRVILSRLCK